MRLASQRKTRLGNDLPSFLNRKSIIHRSVKVIANLRALSRCD